MQISKIENPVGELVKIEFTRASEEDFKKSLMAWIQFNYPDWGYEGFFKRMSTFQAGSCVIDMR